MHFVTFDLVQIQWKVILGGTDPEVDGKGSLINTNSCAFY